MKETSVAAEPSSVAELKYLKAAWYVSSDDSSDERSLTVGQVAQRLAVSHASTSSAFRRLCDRGFLTRGDGREFTLTQAGQQQALRLVRRHRLLETLLADVLGVPWDQVHDETERFEWFISDHIEARIADVLGDPDRDPHGDPIPPLDGKHEEQRDLPLAQVPIGATATLVRVRDDDPALLRFLDEVQLGLGSVVRVERRDPFGGPLWLSSSQGQHALGQPAVRAISVRDVTEDPASA